MDINNRTITATRQHPSGQPIFAIMRYRVTYTSSRPNNNQMRYNFSVQATIDIDSWLNLTSSEALRGEFTIGGVTATFRIKNEADIWVRGESRTLTVSGDFPSTAGNATQAVRFRAVSDGTYSAFATADNSEYTVLSLPLATTAVTAPTTVSVSPAIAESGTATLSWSGAAHGANNTINAYQIWYQDSANGTTWGDWVQLTVLGSTATSSNTSVSTPATRGHFRRFRIRTQGTAGSSFFSGYSVTSNTVRRNTLPTAPTTFTASPGIYAGSQVTLAWSGAAAGTSAIREYTIQQSTSTNNQASWSAWANLTTVTTSATSGSTAVNASTVGGTFTRYRISVTDTLNGVSGFTQSNAVKRNSPPLAPLVEAPKAGSVTYNNYPICLIQTQPEPDGHPQTIWVNGASGEWYNSVDNPELFTTPGVFPHGVKTVFTEPLEFQPGRHTITFKLTDGFSTSPEINRTFTVAASPFAEIVANETIVKASHILALRTAANNVRDYFNLPPYVWEREIIPGKTVVLDWPLHIFELRAAIQGVVNKINSFDANAAAHTPAALAWIPVGSGRPRADVMEELKGLILQL